MKRLRLLIADDHALILQGLQVLLSEHHTIAGTATDGQTLVEMAARLQPEVVVLDISMPTLNGIDAASQIRMISPATKFVFISMHMNAIYVRKAIQAGASAYVSKSGAAEELLRALEEAGQGRTYFSPGVYSGLEMDFSLNTAVRSRQVMGLTTRQRQILQLIAEGKQNKEIAGVLGVSVKTVEYHRGRIIDKLGAHSVADLTRIALQDGLVAMADESPRT